MKKSFVFSLFTFVIVSSLTGFNAQALPINQLRQPLLSVPSSFTTSYDFSGIIKLSNCSGSLIRFETSQDTDKAMVMTNGHCMNTNPFGGMIEPGVAKVNEASNRSFELMNSTGGIAGRLTASHIIYGTMTKTDMAIYRLTSTFAQIRQQYRIEALTLSSKRPDAGTAIEIISGYWKRGYSCDVEKFVHKLEEEGYTWEDSIRYTRPGCEVIGGTSGSPIINAATREVIGINNTGNESGQRCTMNNPCEIDEAGNVTFSKGWDYGQQTYWVYTCLNADNTLNLNKQGCLLFH